MLYGAFNIMTIVTRGQSVKRIRTPRHIVTSEQLVRSLTLTLTVTPVVAVTFQNLTLWSTPYQLPKYNETPPTVCELCSQTDLQTNKTNGGQNSIC